ncbi:hypothetical protein DI09_525p10, partial [Mitosporidium daphniae]
MVLGTLEEITLAEEGTDSEGEVVALAALGAPKWSREVFGKYVSKEIGVDSHDKIVGVLQDFEDCFAGENDRLGVCNVAEHAIETGDCRPIRQSPYSSAWKERELMQTLVQEMEDAGVIEKCNGPWSSPVVLVRKKDGAWRFCVDYRKLNAVTLKDVYPLPRIEETLARLEGSAFFSIMDLQSGYWQVPIKESDRPKSAFITADG